MTSFAKILVPTDFSDCSNLAVDRALDLQRPFGGTMTLLHVYQLPPVYPSGPVLSGELIQATEDAARDELAKLKERVTRHLKPAGDIERFSDVTTKLVMGAGGSR